MTADAKMGAWPAFIFIPDVALADVARHDEDFHRCVESPGLAPSHECE
jgi:hypothetical protein